MGVIKFLGGNELFSKTFWNLGDISKNSFFYDTGLKLVDNIGWAKRFYGSFFGAEN